MKQIHSAGKEWLFVPVPKTCTEPRIIGVVKKRIRDIDLSHGGWFYSDYFDGTWSIFSTLAEVLLNEELTKEMVDKSKVEGWYKMQKTESNIFQTLETTLPYASLHSILRHHYIDPTTHWLILKKEG